MNESATTVSYVGAGLKPAPTKKRTDLPAGWVKSHMNNVCTIILGQSPPSSTYNVNGEGLPFFQGKAEFGERYPIAVKWCSRPKKVAQKNDILISVRAPVGPTNIAPSKCCIGRGLAAIRPLEDIEHLYVYYYLRSIEHELSEMGTGTTFKAISGSDLRAISIPLAPLDQQKLIVAEIEKQFSRLDEAVAALKRIQANLKRYKASVLKAAVEGKLTEEWRSRRGVLQYAPTKDETGADLLKHILNERRKKWEEDYINKYVAAHGHAPKDDSWKKKYKEPVAPDTLNLPKLPKGWVWATLESITIALGGYAFESKKFEDSGYQIVKMANIKMGKIDLSQHPSFIADLKSDVIKKYSLATGDVLVTLTGTRKKRDYGYIAVVKNEAKLLLNQRIARLRPFNGLLPKYLEIAMQSEAYRNRFFSYETGNVGQGNVGMSAISKEPILLPPLLEQQAIIDEIEIRLSIVEETETTIETNIRRAERLRQSILKEAFSGRLIQSFGEEQKHKKETLNG